MLGDGRGQPIGDRPDFATPSRVLPLAEPHRVRDWPAGRAEPLGSPLPPHTRRPRDVIRFTGRALARRPGQLALRRQRTFGAAALVIRGQLRWSMRSFVVRAGMLRGAVAKGSRSPHAATVAARPLGRAAILSWANAVAAT